MSHTRQCNVPALAVDFHQPRHDDCRDSFDPGEAVKSLEEKGVRVIDTLLVPPLFGEVDPPLLLLRPHPSLASVPKFGLCRLIELEERA